MRHKILPITIVILLAVSVGGWLYINQITGWNKDRIQRGEIKPLPGLEQADKNKFDLMVSNLPEDETAKNYYYEIITSENLEYNAVYYKILTNSWRFFWKKYFEKSFTLIFNTDGELIEKYPWTKRLEQ